MRYLSDVTLAFGTNKKARLSHISRRVADLKSIFLRLSLSIFIFFAITSNGYASFSSSFGINSSGHVAGWVYDTANPSTSVIVEVFVDAPFQGGGKFLGTFTANSDSADVDSHFNIVGSHRFDWLITNIDSSNIHLYFVYGLNSSATLTLLTSGALAFPAVTAAVDGSPQTVFDPSTQGCDANDFPDHPARAFRTADGQSNLIASWIYPRKMIGKNLNSVKQNCNFIYKSPGDQQYEHFSYWRWMQAPYTIDGRTVFSITHNEWYGALVKPQCNGDGADSWVSAITLLVSTDMGRTFHQPTDYIIRRPEKEWSNSFPCSASQPTRYGDLGGSNIIFKNGFYYKYFYYEPEPLILPPVGWQCLMRTSNLAFTESYRVLTTTGWLASKTAECTPVLGNNHFRSVTYNTYLKTYVAVMQNGTSFQFSLSKDLLNWTAPTNINFSALDTSLWMYPSIIDPTDTSMNYEYSSKQPFMYYMIYTSAGARTQMRISITFNVSTGAQTALN